MSSRSAQINTPGAIIASSPSDSGDFPVFPCEEPNSKEGGDFWLEMNNRLDKHQSFGYMERGETPPSHLKYRLIPDAGMTAVALPAVGHRDYMQTVKHNAACHKLTMENDLKSAQLIDAQASDNRHLAAAIDQSLRLNAPLLLDALQVAHVNNTLIGSACGSSATTTASAPTAVGAAARRAEYDAGAMLRAWRAKHVSGRTALKEQDARWHEKQYEIMRDSPLPDKCASQDYSAKCTKLRRDHVPHFKVVRLEGEDMSLALIRFMPQCLSQAGTFLINELTTVVLDADAMAHLGVFGCDSDLEDRIQDITSDCSDSPRAWEDMCGTAGT